MTFQILTYIAATAFPLLALMDVYRRRKEFDSIGLDACNSFCSVIGNGILLFDGKAENS